MVFLKWAAIFFVIALIAGGLGFSGIAAGAGNVAEFLFYLFLGVCLIFLVIGIFLVRKLT
ncbi:MAG: DUF1328 domain-containing protein [Nitrospirales bacterium]